MGSGNELHRQKKGPWNLEDERERDRETETPWEMKEAEKEGAFSMVSIRPGCLHTQIKQPYIWILIFLSVISNEWYELISTLS